MFIRRIRSRSSSRLAANPGLAAGSRLATRSRFALAAAALLLLSFASPALAGEPATVTVRVVGANNQTLVPLTQVTTTTAPVVKDGNPADSCPGTNALGALQLATAGNWEGPWNSKYGQYEVITIAGESHPFEAPAAGKPSHYWDFWLDNKEASSGACEAELHSGDSVLFFVGCSALAAECQSAPNALDVLGVEAPATVEVNKPVTVTVRSYPVEGGSSSPVVGATVVGGGDASAPPTNELGQTTLTFSGDGRYTLHATGAQEGPTSVPGEVFICAHEGNDGTCGTTLPPSGGTTTSTPSGSSVGTGTRTGPAQIELARITGIKNGRHYSRRSAPRVLTGSVTVSGGDTLQSVQISLQRSHAGRCFDYSGRKEKFVHAKCGRTSFFSVGSSSSFNYLLPARLPAGRYVYEIRAIDSAGHTTALANGVSRVVLYVR
jgi:hypothetical protein